MILELSGGTYRIVTFDKSNDAKVSFVKFQGCFLVGGGMMEAKMRFLLLVMLLLLLLVLGPTFIASGLDSHPGRPGGACVRGRASVRRAAGDLGVWQVKDQTEVLFHHRDEIDQIFP